MTPAKFARAIRKRGVESFGHDAKHAAEALDWLAGHHVTRDFVIETRIVDSPAGRAWAATLKFGVMGYSAATPLISIYTDGRERV